MVIICAIINMGKQILQIYKYLLLYCPTVCVWFLLFCIFFSFSETIAEQINIPSVFASYYASHFLRNYIIPEQG